MIELLPIIQLSLFLAANVVILILLLINYWDQSRIMSSYAKAICIVGVLWQPIEIYRSSCPVEAPAPPVISFIKNILYHSQLALMVVIQMQLLKVFSGMTTWLKEKVIQKLQWIIWCLTILVYAHNSYIFAVPIESQTEFGKVISRYYLQGYVFLGLVYETFHFIFLAKMLSILTSQKKHVASAIRRAQRSSTDHLMYLSIFNIATSWFSFGLYVLSTRFPLHIQEAIASFSSNMVAIHVLCVLFANVLVRKIQIPSHEKSKKKSVLSNLFKK
jgi:hypothetical protein